MSNAASHGAFGPQELDTSEEMDMAVCRDSPYVLSVDDSIATSRSVPRLAQLDIHHHLEHLRLCGAVRPRSAPPCFCQRAGVTQAARQVPVHQGHRLLLLLAGKICLSHLESHRVLEELCVCIIAGNRARCVGGDGGREIGLYVAGC